MAPRTIRLEVPELKNVQLPSLEVVGVNQSLPALLMELSEHLSHGNERSKLVPALRDTARLLEALRFGLMGADADDYDQEHMTDGEIAALRGQRTISGQLETIITLMKEEAEAKRLDRTST